MSALQDYIIALGYLGITSAVFAESGFLLGFFLPGDSLLFTIGLLSSTKNIFNIYALLGLCAIAAIAGDSFGYFMGKQYGQKLFYKDDSFIFKKKYLTETQNFYIKHGASTIILARFVPIVRTFAPIIAGVGNMDYRKFVLYNVLGGIGWSWGFLLGGFFLGRIFPGIGVYIEYIVILIIFLSVLPIAGKYLVHRKKSI